MIMGGKSVGAHKDACEEAGYLERLPSRGTGSPAKGEGLRTSTAGGERKNVTAGGMLTQKVPGRRELGVIAPKFRACAERQKRLEEGSRSRQEKTFQLSLGGGGLASIEEVRLRGGGGWFIKVRRSIGRGRE